MTFTVEQIEAILQSVGISDEQALVIATEMEGAHGVPSLFCQQLAQHAFNIKPVNRVAFLVASRAAFLWAGLEAEIWPKGEPIEHLRDRLFNLSTV